MYHFISAATIDTYCLMISLALVALAAIELRTE